MSRRYYFAAIHRDRGPSNSGRDIPMSRAEARYLGKMAAPVGTGFGYLFIAAGILLVGGVILSIAGIWAAISSASQLQGPWPNRLQQALQDLRREEAVMYHSIAWGALVSTAVFLLIEYWMTSFVVFLWWLACLGFLAYAQPATPVDGRKA
jgi:hypothetical protein